MERREGFVTPEAVALTIDAAGLGSRMIAAGIDSAIQAVCMLALALIMGGVGETSSTTAVIVVAIGAFVVIWGYYPLFEGIWNGRTPGKRSQGLRVVRIDGQPVTIGPVLVRNLIRIVDFLPVSYGIGVVTMLISRRSQRLGDLAAGTVVIRERRTAQPLPLVLAGESGMRVDTAGLSQRQYVLVRDFLQRRPSLDPHARRALAAQLAASMRGAVGEGPSDDEAFLEAVLVSFRDRSAGGSALP